MFRPERPEEKQAEPLNAETGATDAEKLQAKAHALEPGSMLKKAEHLNEDGSGPRPLDKGRAIPNIL